MWWALARVWWKPALALFLIGSLYLYIASINKDNENLRYEIEDYSRYETTTKRVNNAVKKSERLDVDAARDWLRKYADR